MPAYTLDQNSAATPLQFLMLDGNDHLTGITGRTPVVVISKNGGAFVTPAGAVSELGDGWYQVAGNATDTNTIGPLVLHATATGADPCDEVYQVTALAKLKPGVSDPAVVPAIDADPVLLLQMIAARLGIVRKTEYDKVDDTLTTYRADAVTPWFTSATSSSPTADVVNAST